MKNEISNIYRAAQRARIDPENLLNFVASKKTNEQRLRICILKCRSNNLIYVVYFLRKKSEKNQILLDFSICLC